HQLPYATVARKPFQQRRQLPPHRDGHCVALAEVAYGDGRCAVADMRFQARFHARILERPGRRRPDTIGGLMSATLVAKDLAAGPRVARARPRPPMSGAQPARASLASLLLSRYDIFLLDEPTNDLDLDGLRRLETFVTGLRAGTVLVSHDREFLTRTVSRVVELDLAQQQVRSYGGGYGAYLEEREVARRHARQEYEEYADTRATL